MKICKLFKTKKFTVIVASIIAFAIVAGVVTTVFIQSGNKKHTAAITEAEKDKAPADNQGTDAPDNNEQDSDTTPADKAASPDEATDYSGNEDITTPSEITEIGSLEALIAEFNDPNTSPERKDELSKLLGDFFNTIPGETVSLPAE